MFDVMTPPKRVLSITIAEIGGKPLTVGTIVLLALLLVMTFVAARVARAGVLRAFRNYEIGRSGAFAQIVHHMIVFVGVAVAVDTAGIELKALFAAGAVFAVGLGFAMQNIAQNFVAGLILLFERSIKAGDVLEIEGKVVRVKELRIRTTLVRTRDDEELIIPNSTLAQSTVKSYTLADSIYRLSVSVGVSYGDDMNEVRRTLEETAREAKWRFQEHDPLVLLVDFADSSVVWEVHVWTNEPWMARIQQAALREAIWHRLKDRSLTIAFPQVDVHFDPPIAKALSALTKPPSASA